MYDFASWLAQPYTILLLSIAAALVWARRVSPGATKAITAGMWALLLLVVASLPCTSYSLFRFVESQYAPEDIVPRPDDVIVVLTGKVLRADKSRPYDLPAESSLCRCHHAAYLYRTVKCRMLISGNAVSSSTRALPTSEILKNYLITIGVDPADIVCDDTSHNTYDSAVACRDFLTSPESRLILVTEGYHMWRSMAVFEAHGLKPIAAPCNLQATRLEAKWTKFVPNPRALASFHTVAHELTGLAWYYLRGHLS
jgi:uncharacterized SAM-binding protein YcdF (DUF218 family)